MKKVCSIPFFLLLATSSFCFPIENRNAVKRKAFISNIEQIFIESISDTLWVSQNDTAVFKQVVGFVHHPCSKPKLVTYYELIQPKDSTYYFIYNSNKELILEGQYIVESELNKSGNFYNSKRYYYKKNGTLNSIHYQKDGRNFKTEYFDRKKRFTKIRYIDKKSEETTKIEIYKKGLLKETRIYKSFSTYCTVKAKQ